MSVQEVMVRHIKAGELDALLELYGHLPAQDPPLPSAEEFDGFWDRALANPMLHYLVAEVDHRLVASCLLVIVPNLTRGTRPYGLIENVVTHADYRRRGLGTSVVRQALEVAWEADCYKVMLLTGSDEPGVHAFYRQVGFRKGIRTGFVADPPETGPDPTNSGA